MSSSGGSSRPRNWTGVSCTAGGFFTCWASGEAHIDVKTHTYGRCPAWHSDIVYTQKQTLIAVVIIIHMVIAVRNQTGNYKVWEWLMKIEGVQRYEKRQQSHSQGNCQNEGAKTKVVSNFLATFSVIIKNRKKCIHQTVREWSSKLWLIFGRKLHTHLKWW